jgi:hypothetical protein
MQDMAAEQQQPQQQETCTGTGKCKRQQERAGP